MNRTVRALAAAAALASILAVAACGSDSAGSTGSSHGSGHEMSSVPAGPPASSTSAPAAGPGAAGRNQADVTFASSMVPHHEQAITMADLALAKATDARVRQLASQIKKAQDPEITTMTAWLTSWGSAPMPSGHDMGGMEMDGMMTDQQMRDLERSSGAAFDRMWLDMMIEHHQGAVAMARTQLDEGRLPEVKALSRAVIEGQTQEIATMTQLVRTLE